MEHQRIFNGAFLKVWKIWKRMEVNLLSYEEDQYLEFEVVSYEEDERVQMEVDDSFKRQLFELFKNLQQRRHIKVTATATQVRLDYIEEENSHPQLAKSKRIGKIIEVVKIALKTLNSDPIVITSLPIQENVKYL